VQARLILIKGRVQGIGFRAYVRKIAKPLNITGYAKNLSGGDVEILAIGEKGQLDILYYQIHEKFHLAIESIHTRDLFPIPSCGEFSIL
jgi:acylphosphatase